MNKIQSFTAQIRAAIEDLLEKNPSGMTFLEMMPHVCTTKDLTRDRLQTTLRKMIYLGEVISDRSNGMPYRYKAPGTGLSQRTLPATSRGRIEVNLPDRPLRNAIEWSVFQLICLAQSGGKNASR